MWPFRDKKKQIVANVSKVQPLKLQTEFESTKDVKDYLAQEVSKLDGYTSVLNQLSQQLLKVEGIDRGAREYLAHRYRILCIIDWRHAMLQADQSWIMSFRSAWVGLFDIFFNVVQDTQVQAAIDTISEGVLSMNYCIKVNNVTDEEATKLFQKSWYEDWVRINIDNVLFGFGLTQIQNMTR